MSLLQSTWGGAPVALPASQALYAAGLVAGVAGQTTTLQLRPSAASPLSATTFALVAPAALAADPYTGALLSDAAAAQQQQQLPSSAGPFAPRVVQSYNVAVGPPYLAAMADPGLWFRGSAAALMGSNPARTSGLLMGTRAMMGGVVDRPDAYWGYGGRF